jgi:hypothetical protein
MAKVQAASTQDHVPIAGVRDGIIIMKDGSFRLVLSISPINFSLKSEQEQNALIFKYQSFLNSLHFPIQITMQSKRLDLTPYLQKMKKIAEKQSNELLRIQTEDYISFVGELINIANIMSKSFFLTVSYTPLSVPKLSFLDKLTGRAASGNTLRISDTDFESHSQELMERGNTIAGNLGSMGLRVRQLSTQEILEMFYNLYNPEEAGKERLIPVEEMEASVVIDKNEAIAAHVAENKEEKPGIDNSDVVAESQKKDALQPEAASPKSSESDSTNPASEPVAEKKSADEPPPIKQRLEKQQSSDQPSQPQAPATTPPDNKEPGQPLANDNYQLK